MNLKVPLNLAATTCLVVGDLVKEAERVPDSVSVLVGLELDLEEGQGHGPQWTGRKK